MTKSYIIKATIAALTIFLGYSLHSWPSDFTPSHRCKPNNVGICK